MRSSEKNRYQDYMTISNIGLACVLTNPFGRTATDIMKRVLSSEVFNDDDIKKLIRDSAKKKSELIVESFRDNNLILPQSMIGLKSVAVTKRPLLPLPE